MAYYAFICTRSNEMTPTKSKLLQYLEDSGVKIELIVGSTSIFKGYKETFHRVNPHKDDVIILCHDDIEIIDSWKKVATEIDKYIKKPTTGFLGLAGTTKLTSNAVWWDKDCWQNGLLRGRVRHGPNLKDSYITTFGPPNHVYGEVVVMDGLFLVARAEILRNLDLGKPDYFPGDWDFYDILYTSQAYKKGYRNYVVNIDVLHNSKGELAGRDSWHENRMAFIHRTLLPITLQWNIL